MIKKKKGFTLIELIGALVIMTIIALILTPLVLNIIRKARVSADKRSIDAYGRSIELAVSSYLLDNGKFPTSVEQLTIEYSGNQVACETTQLNPDSSVYLSGCTVAGRTVDYTYGTDNSPSYTAYSVGDEVTYNNVDYYVIKDSGAKESTVTLLKAEPLSVSDVNTYGAWHVNRYTLDSVGTAYDKNGYGGMAYYTSETCGLNNGVWIKTGCTNDYAQSEVKYVVDAWKNAKAPAATESRLITVDEIRNNLGYELGVVNISDEAWLPSESTPNWTYNSNYDYLIASLNVDSANSVGHISKGGGLFYTSVMSLGFVVRPVIVLPKSVL